MAKMTEFEDKLACAFHEVKTWKNDGNDAPVREYAKIIANELMDLARKQIASEIDVDAMEVDYDTRYMRVSALSELAHEHYRQGIEDTLKAIKGE